jgi:hypothetical protein
MQFAFDTHADRLVDFFRGVIDDQPAAAKKKTLELDLNLLSLEAEIRDTNGGNDYTWPTTR